MEIRRTYKYRLFRNRHNKRLHQIIDIAGLIWNHAIALQRRYYRSFTLKQAGWKLLDKNKIEILGYTYKFVKHREIGGTIKTVTIKRDSLNRLWLAFSVVENIHIPEASTGKIGGFDFGLKTFLTDDEGGSTHSPQFFKEALHRVAQCNRTISRKTEPSRNRSRAKRQLGIAHQHISNKRRDHHFKLAHDLCDEYDLIFFETLNLEGMKRLWGRKVSDLGFKSFLQILETIAFKRGKRVIYLGQWEPTTQMCSDCGYRQKMDLSQRVFECPNCGLRLDRDHNAARNIKRVGTSTLGLEVVRRSYECNLV